MRYFSWDCGYYIVAKNKKEAQRKAYDWSMATLEEFKQEWVSFGQWKKVNEINELTSAKQLTPGVKCNGIYVDIPGGKEYEGVL